MFWYGAAVIGFVAALFALAADHAQQLFRTGVGQWPWLPFLVMPLGLGVSAWAALRIVPGSQGSGIPQAIAARHLRSTDDRRSLLSMRIAMGKIALTLLGLLCGASIGREGPTVQIGASLMLAAGRIAGLGREPGLILVGSAAGVAAAFNTPLAGIVFAIEEMARSFERRTSSLMLVAVLLAGLVAVAMLGNYTYFGSTAAVVGWRDWKLVIAAGLAGGLAGGVFSRLLLGAGVWLPRLCGGRLARHPVLFAMTCGLLLALIGTASGGLTYGTGYEEARAALDGTAALPWHFAPAKLLSTLLSAVSGIPGGIFAPSLSVGAGVGVALDLLLPGSPAGAAILLAMAGYLAGVVQSPLTAVIIMMEMSAAPGILLPLLLCTVLASTVSRLICPKPLYHAMAEKFLRSRPS